MHPRRKKSFSAEYDKISSLRRRGSSTLSWHTDFPPTVAEEAQDHLLDAADLSARRRLLEGVVAIQEAVGQYTISDIVFWLVLCALLIFLMVYYWLPSTDCRIQYLQNSVHSWAMPPALPPADPFVSRTQIPSLPAVCVLGRAGTTGHLRQMVRNFPGLQFFVDITDEPAARRGFVEENVYVLPVPVVESVARVAERLGRKQAPGNGYARIERGLEALVKFAKDKNATCDYYFLIDPETVWWPTSVGISHYKTTYTTEILLRMLSDYRPLVVAFPWSEGEAAFDSLAIMGYHYRQSVVQPLTGFDSRSLLFHHSVFSLFHPLYLGRGKEVWRQWGEDEELRSVYLNFFLPFLLRGRALRFNALDSDSLTVAPALRAISGEGQALEAELSSNCLCRHRRYGPSLIPNDIRWEVSVREGLPPASVDKAHALFNPETDVFFFNITDPLYAHHPAVSSRYTLSQLLDIQSIATTNHISNTLVEQCDLLT